MDSRTFAAAVLLFGQDDVGLRKRLLRGESRVGERQGRGSKREIGAEQRAPYEYYFAKAHLDQARVEASEASYGDAANFAEVAEEYAQKAIQLTQGAQGRGAK